ncbi:LysM peptidoglycan-binding domain-containing protein [Alteromonas flava]|uniref:LysM peptidoglycan-binding domain-containing protein n=1 Tax=Alteromonas flava TaxID=2048003 RepID=UPI000F5DF3CD|nr:LysM domain-containing protein [Alteromonas flava]
MSINTLSSLVGAYLQNNNVTRAEALLAQVSEQDYTESLWRYSAEIALRKGDITSAKKALTYVAECDNLALFRDRFDSPIDCMQTVKTAGATDIQSSLGDTTHKASNYHQAAAVSNASSMLQKKQTKGSQLHFIQAGETFYSLAKRYGVSVAQLRQNNPQLDIFDIPIGTSIVIHSP